MTVRDYDIVVPSSRPSRASAGSYELSVTLKVEDGRALWSAAVRRALAAGMDMSDVVEVIGPAEEPSIGDCIALLLDPSALAGCDVEAFEVRSGTASNFAKALAA